jgi:predicted nucleic acid-binding protein
VIAADTNVWIGYFNQTLTRQLDAFHEAVLNQSVLMPLPVLHELFCFPELSDLDRKSLGDFQRLQITEAIWLSAGEMRRKILAKKQKCRAMDALIAQVCIENKVSFLTLDTDFERFSAFGLKLVK